MSSCRRRRRSRASWTRVSGSCTRTATTTSQLLPCGVLVVGAGHPARTWRWKVARARPTWLCGRDTGHVPFDIESRSARPAIRVLWFLAKRAHRRTPLGRKLQRHVRNHGCPLLRVKNEHLEAAGVQRVHARMAGVRDGPPLLEDGRVLDVSNVIWCTGFRPDFSWIEPSVTGPDGWPVQDRGVATGVPGLYFAGLLFQYSFTSMLVGGAGRDAAYIAHASRGGPPCSSVPGAPAA